MLIVNLYMDWNLQNVLDNFSGDVVLLGKTNCFQFNNPAQVARMRRARRSSSSFGLVCIWVDKERGKRRGKPVCQFVQYLFSRMMKIIFYQIVPSTPWEIGNNRRHYRDKKRENTWCRECDEMVQCTMPSSKPLFPLEQSENVMSTVFPLAQCMIQSSKPLFPLA